MPTGRRRFKNGSTLGFEGTLQLLKTIHVEKVD
jgi:hypothetical protein